MALCEKCVLLVQDDKKICKHCETYVTTTIDWGIKEAEFINLVDAFRGKGNKYDFIVPLTGGKDSTYVLYYLTKVIKDARVLAYTWDNYLIRETAWENIRNAVKATGVDYKIGKWDRDKTIRAFRATFCHTAKMCYCSHYLSLNMLPFAIRENIPVVITGFSEGQRELNHSFKMPDQKYQKQQFADFFKMFKTLLSESLREYEADSADETIDHFFGDYANYVNPDSQIKFYPVMVPLSNYINWLEINSLKNTLTKHMNWKQAAESIAHTSCMIEPIKGYLEYTKKLQEMSSELSNLIRAGYMSRKDAVDDMQMMCMNGEIPNNLSDFCRFISIKEEDFHKIAKTKSIPGHLVESLLDSVAWQFGIDEFKTSLV